MAASARRFMALLAMTALGCLMAARADAARYRVAATDPPPELPGRSSTLERQRSSSANSPANGSTNGKSPDQSPDQPVAEGAPRRPSAVPEPVEPLVPVDEELVEEDYPAPIFSSGDWFTVGCWYFQGDLVLMHRTNPKPLVLAFDTTTPNANPADPLNNVDSLSTQGPGFRIAPGMRLTLGRLVGRDHANRDQSIEFTFLGLIDWDTADGTSSADPASLYTPIDQSFYFDPVVPEANATIGAFNAADSQNYTYGSDLGSFEINFRTRYRLDRDLMVAMPDGTWSRQLNPGSTPSLLAGLRYFRLREQFDWHSERGGGSPPATGDYSVDTYNNLAGIQIGADWYWQEKDWRLGGWIKLGGFVNFARQNSRILAIDSFAGFEDVDQNRSGSEQAFTFAGEAGLSGAYYFNPNVALRGGLEMLWVQSVAVATEQLSFNFTAPPTVDLSGNSFFLGASFGLEVVW